MSDLFYVYVVFDLHAVPRYVGKGKGRRWTNHLWRSHNVDVRRLVEKSGGELPIVVVHEGLTEQEAFRAEIDLIAAIGRGMDGPLLNLTDGGDGVVGHKRTDEQRTAMSAARKGRTLSLESRIKVSQALKGRPKSPEHRAAAAAARKAVGNGPLSQAHREAIGQAHLGQKRSPEARAAMKAAAEAMTPEQRALKSLRITLALTGKKLTPEHRAKISAVQKGVPKGRKALAEARAQRMTA